ncbi:MAG: tripartite tricarboxylate transporter substrate binding protein [Proteobacteria bacterium]|nr:tripartite tricarboxylate transporter substrate binding protein [Burkholderiales bacterium]
MDEGYVHREARDVVIQLSINYNWRTPGTEDCVTACVLSATEGDHRLDRAEQGSRAVSRAMAAAAGEPELAMHLAAVMLLALVAATAAAQPFPFKPIRIVVAATPGGGVDTTSRIVGQGLSDRFGQPVVIENRPGGGGALAGDIVARAAPDGHTLKTISISHSVLPSTHRNLPYSPERDLVPVSVMVNGPNVLVVHPSVPARSVKELVALARAQPGQLLYSSSGNAGPPHMAMELFKMVAGIDLVHIPYKGTGPGITDLVAGRVAMTFASVISVRQYVDTGRLRLLATSGAKRAAIIPDVPTMAEAGVPGYAVDVWYAMFAPAATPREALLLLNAEVARFLNQPPVKAKLADQGLETVADSLDRTDAYIKAETLKWAKVVKAAKIVAE